VMPPTSCSTSCGRLPLLWAFIGRDSAFTPRGARLLTGIRSVFGIGQARKMARHSSIDMTMTMVYQLEDKAEQERGV
jgi:hypothetical protein